MKRLIAISLTAVLALGLAPRAVMALTQPGVSLDDDTISATAQYTIMFTIAADVAEGEDIIIAFPDDTDITNVDAADCTIAATSGIGSNAFNATAATSISKSDAELTITVPDVNTQDKIGIGAMVQVIVGDVLNPSNPGDYTLTVATSGETTPVESNPYAIEIPTLPPVPGIVQLYNPSDILMAQYTGDDAIQSAIDDAGVDYTVKVGSGTYRDNIELKDGVQVLGAGANVTTIDGGGSGSAVTADSVGAETVLDGFTIKNGDGDPDGGGIILSDSSPEISNNIITQNTARGGGGIYVTGSSNASIIDNVIEANVAQGSAGIQVSGGASANISGNHIVNNQAIGGYGGGIRIEFASSVTVVNNIIEGNSAQTFGGAIYIRSTSSVKIINNTIVGNEAKHTSGGGILVTDSQPVIRNNIISQNFNYGIVEDVGSSDPLLSFNLFFGNTPAIYLDEFTTALNTIAEVNNLSEANNNLSANPLFVDPAGGDYHLQGDSPCIDAGTNTGAPTEDIEGNTRPIDGDGDSTATTDMGAYEYVPSCPPSPPVEVGGDVYPVNKLTLLAPWIALTAVIIASTIIVVRRRRAQS